MKKYNKEFSNALSENIIKAIENVGKQPNKNISKSKFIDKVFRLLNSDSKKNKPYKGFYSSVDVYFATTRYMNNKIDSQIKIGL